MKKIRLVCMFIPFLIGGVLMAQSNDTIPAKKVTEKGEKGDIILGKEYRKKQLGKTPQSIQSADSALKKETVIQSEKKKCRHRKSY
jgi:hypothetical protein